MLFVKITENFKCFQYFNFETIFLKNNSNNNKNPRKLEYSFLVESTDIENATIPYKTALSEVRVKANRMRITKWTYHKERIN